MLILFTLLPFDLPEKQTHVTTEDICVICRRAQQCDVPDSIVVNGSNVCHEHLHVVLGLDLRCIPHEPVLLVTGDDIDDYAICLRQRPLQKTCMFRPHGEKQLQLSYAASGKPSRQSVCLHIYGRSRCVTSEQDRNEAAACCPTPA